KKKNVLKVFAFEPMEPVFKIMQANITANPDVSGKIEIFPYGLGKADAVFEVPFSLSNNVNASCHGLFDSGMKGTHMEKLEVRDVVKIVGPIIDENRAKKILFKVDCEGSEFDIIPRLAETGILQKIDVIIMEFHGQSPECLLEALQESGFFAFWNWTETTGIPRGMIRAVRV
ncbi:MAG: FkbM family methyltransferase, partial [Puniceicoccales bacterium]|nr:FkbM family methyltransferase [Puniceicoccales bacterium]